MAKARQIANILEADVYDESVDYYEENPSPVLDNDSTQTVQSTRLIQVQQSPYLDTFYRHTPIRITIDSGATGNMMSLSTAKRLGAEITASFQSAQQADGSSPVL